MIESDFLEVVVALRSFTIDTHICDLVYAGFRVP